MGWKACLIVIVVLIILEFYYNRINQRLKTWKAGRSFQRHQLNTEATTLNQITEELMIKYNQVAHIVKGMKDCKPINKEIDEKFKTLVEMPKTWEHELEFRPLKSESVELVRAHLEFYDKIPYYTVEDFEELWVKAKNPSYSQFGRDVLAVQIKEHEDIKTFMRINVKHLEAQWKSLNLHQRLRNCRDKLTALIARVSGKPITGAEVKSTLQIRMKIVSDLIVQCDVANELLKKSSAALENKPVIAETLAIDNKLKDIRKEFLANLKKLDTAYKTLKKGIKVWSQSDSTGTFTTTELSAKEGIKEAYAVNVELLVQQWYQLNLVQQAGTLLDEVKAVESRGDRIDEL